MKNILIRILAVVSLCMTMASCNDSFLEVYPKDQQTEATAFQTYENFKTYAWSLYSIFPGYTDPKFSEEINAGHFVTKANSIQGAMSSWGTGNVIVPSSGGDWDFTYIRNVNLMLDNVDASAMSDEEKAHWRSVGYFFRSYRYYTLLAQFGDVPFIDHVLNTESEELYAERDSRDVVADRILKDLQYAAENIRENGDGKNTINRNVVNAMLSRFGLFEGTWRKYHGLADADTYLKAAVTAAKAVLASNNSLNNQFDALFNSTASKISAINEVLLYREYRPIDNEGHSLVRSLRTGEAQVEVTRHFVDLFLCTDGRPISTSAVYEFNDETDPSKKEYANFRNRDRRLYLTVLPPYMTNNARSGNILEEQVVRYPEGHEMHWADEYIDMIESNKGSGWAGYKTLPASNFKGYHATRVPNLWQSKNGVWNWQKAYMGYVPWKFYNEWVTALTNMKNDDSAAPIFRVAEVMLNYAEAAAELGDFTQTIADETINRLRDRGAVAHMIVDAIDANWDTARDSDVDPVIWEIRRERAVELAAEGFAFNDARRWKKAESQLSKMPVGAYIKKADYGNPADMKLAKKNADGSYTIDDTLTEGYVCIGNLPAHGWQSHYYLYPLPLDDLALNKNLKQNNGWGSSVSE